MRLEINTADERPEAQILRAEIVPGAYLLELVLIDSGGKAPRTPGGQPDYSAIFSDARNCPSAFKSKEEVDKYIDRLRIGW